MAAHEVRAEEATTAGETGASPGGVLSRILKLFRGQSEKAAPAQAQENGREPASEDVRRQPTEPSSSQGRERNGGTAVEATYSHVYQAAQDLVAEIDLLRGARNVSDARPVEPSLQPDRSPTHAFVMAMAAMEKTARVQRRLGMIPVEPVTTPIGNIAPRNVLRIVDTVMEELRRIKRQLVITDAIESASFAGGKTPSRVYQRLGHASLLLDALVGRPPTPNEVDRYVSLVHGQMDLIGARLGAVLEHEAPAVEGPKAPVECAQQLVRAIYKAIRLQTRLGVDASTVPNMILEQVTASGVFDATNLLLAEILRISAHLSIDEPLAEHSPSRTRQWRDVFARVLLVVTNLDRLTRAVDEADEPKERSL